MYQRRLKIFVGLCVGVLLIALVRLAFLQVFGAEAARRRTDELRILPPEVLATVRGKILDRSGRVLALDRPAFSLYINYGLSCHADERWREGHILRQITASTPRDEIETQMNLDWAENQQMLRQAVELAAFLGDVPRDEIENRIEEINNRIWELTRYIWWRRRNPDAPMAEYRRQRDAISPAQIVRTDLREMRHYYPLIELPTDEALLNAQIELVQMRGLTIRPEARRSYPYETAACQLLGWVAPGQEEEIQLFEDDEYQRYLEGEVLGKEGLEKAFEPILRGRRGRVVYDREGNELSRTEPQFGGDVHLTLDIELQQQIQSLLLNPETNPNASSPCAAVVLDGATNDILAMVSTPVFDLNTVRRDYTHLIKDPNKPMTHRALESNYPPGSCAKPLILMIGLEEEKIRPDEIISCPYTGPLRGWPRCLLQRNYGSCHDWRWEHEGGNNPVNALRGSCNIYFSQLAHRIEAKRLQTWLFELGFGQSILNIHFPQEFIETHSRFADITPRIRQAHGSLVYDPVNIVQLAPAVTSKELTVIPDWERKWWGIGQGNLRVTVLQAANALAAIARNGIYKQPRLILDEADYFNERGQRKLLVSNRTFEIVRKGMSAVIRMEGGSAYSIFRNSELFDRGINLYGKTGSTERPEHAWFECFAEDNAGRIIIVAVLVEGGSRGGQDAAPLGRDILTLCSDAGYIGTRTPTPHSAIN